MLQFGSANAVSSISTKLNRFYLQVFDSYTGQDGLIEFSLNRDAFCRFYRITKISNIKYPLAKYYHQWILNPGTSDFHILHAIAWANSLTCWKSQPFRSLHFHTLLIPKINVTATFAVSFLASYHKHRFSPYLVHHCYFNILHNYFTITQNW